ncbi:(2Fe-2S) ferredoxin domain-containing protein [Candidatus Woesearchaeota archaeon]|nr:(2Fe-2S) ferredoxin domain-containing protein [Candidatus Woesearchaeota archaeon]
MAKQILTTPKMHVFVCINERINDAKPSCAPRITEEDVKEIKLWLREQGYTNEIFCSNTKCLGFCNAEGSVICIWPQGKFYKVQNKEEIKKLIQKEFK